jgi:hypothetical protein
MSQEIQEMVKKRLDIEKYFNFDHKCREYIIDRVCQLSRGSCISQYKWNSGTAKFNNILWNHEKYPSDAFLLMTLFCRFMDENYPARVFMDDYPFTSKYFAGDRKLTGLMIRQAKKYPAHYQILLDSTCYNVLSVRTI